MKEIIDVQDTIFLQLIERLRAVPVFGDTVEEGNVLRLIDSEDEELPDSLIVLQEGDTTESERVTPSNAKETLTINIVAMTRVSNFGPPLRAARLAIKQALKGTHASLSVPGLNSVSFPSATPMPPEKGKRWAFRVIPVTFTYVQQL
ncbi:hypothetical protein [Pseudomonas nitroreducens]|uniref:hypothetical protein n=1 Tax=Pseudomonas nitroreducens TaxID=46680 RepID=UPI003CC82842